MISYVEKIADCMEWLGREDSNLRMTIPKTVALPLGDVPMYEFAVLMSFLRGLCCVDRKAFSPSSHGMTPMFELTHVHTIQYVTHV